MEPGALINSLLLANAAVVALVGERIYPLRAPQGTKYPYVLYQVVSGNPDTSAQCELPDTARVQLSLFCETYPSVAQVHKACRAALNGQEVGSVSILFDGYQESYQDNALCYLRTQDYLLDGLTA